MVFPRFALGVIFGYAESNVTFFVTPDCQGVPIGDQNPLANVKFTLFYN